MKNIQKNSLEKQIKNAEYSLANWPEWMKIIAIFTGSNRNLNRNPEKD